MSKSRNETLPLEIPGDPTLYHLIHDKTKLIREIEISMAICKMKDRSDEVYFQINETKACLEKLKELNDPVSISQSISTLLNNDRNPEYVDWTYNPPQDDHKLWAPYSIRGVFAQRVFDVPNNITNFPRLARDTFECSTNYCKERTAREKHSPLNHQPSDALSKLTTEETKKISQELAKNEKLPNALFWYITHREELIYVLEKFHAVLQEENLTSDVDNDAYNDDFNAREKNIEAVNCFIKRLKKTYKPSAILALCQNFVEGKDYAPSTSRLKPISNQLIIQLGFPTNHITPISSREDISTFVMQLGRRMWREQYAYARDHLTAIHNWGNVSVATAFVRANEGNPLKTSILPLFREINKYAGTDSIPHTSKPEEAFQWLTWCVNTRIPEFYKNERKEKLNRHKETITELQKELEKKTPTKATEKEKFQTWISILEEKYKEGQDAWCKPFFRWGSPKPPQEYCYYLNNNPDSHHYKRMLGIILKLAYEKYPDLITYKRALVTDLEEAPPRGYRFTRPQDAQKSEPTRASTSAKKA